MGIKAKLLTLEDFEDLGIAASIKEEKPVNILIPMSF